MSHYLFLCQECRKEFALDMHMAERAKQEPVCPHCGSKKVTQALEAFNAVTERKS